MPTQNSVSHALGEAKGPGGDRWPSLGRGLPTPTPLTRQVTPQGHIALTDSP